MADKVYLAGPIQSASDGGHFWRDYLKERYDRYGLGGMDLELLDPLDKYDSHANDVVVCTEDEYETTRIDNPDAEIVSDTMIVESDKEMIDQSSAVIVGWDRIPSVGTPMEILYCYERDIPVVVWFEPRGSSTPLEDRNLSPWITYHTHSVNQSLGDTIEALKEVLGYE